MVWHARASRSHAGVDGACACKKKWFLKNTLPVKNAVFTPDRPVHWNTPRDIYTFGSAIRTLRIYFRFTRYPLTRDPGIAIYS